MFKTGTVVRFKSGGNPMTTAQDPIGPDVVCVWEDGQGKHRQSFPTEALEEVGPIDPNANMSTASSDWDPFG